MGSDTSERSVTGWGKKYVCERICVSIYMCICMYVHIHIYVCMGARIHICVYMYIINDDDNTLSDKLARLQWLI